MYKLLMKAFPGFYKGNSVYAMYPFNIPDENRVILKDLGRDQDFDWCPPKLTPPFKSVTRHEAVLRVLGDQTNFKVPCKFKHVCRQACMSTDLNEGGPNTTTITHQNYMLSGDSAANEAQRVHVNKALYPAGHGMNDIAKLYERVTEECIREHSKKLRSGYIVDAIAE